LASADGGFQEIRLGHWKAERLNVSNGKEPFVELYDLDKDISQTKNVAGEHPDLVKRFEQIAAEAHTPNAMFPLTFAERRAAAPPGVAPKKKAAN
jgi:hypothetical protein